MFEEKVIAAFDEEPIILQGQSISSVIDSSCSGRVRRPRRCSRRRGSSLRRRPTRMRRGKPWIPRRLRRPSSHTRPYSQFRNGEREQGKGFYAHSRWAAALRPSVKINILEAALSIKIVYSFRSSARKIVNSISFRANCQSVPLLVNSTSWSDRATLRVPWTKMRLCCP